MQTFKEFNLLNEKPLHIFMKKMDIRIAKSIHKKLIEAQVISRKHKFGEILDKSNINGFYSHSSESSHNYREEIESYNQIIQRNSDYIDGTK